MIPRYSKEKMKKIWDDKNRFQIWLEIEILACEAQENIGVIPKGSTKIIKEKASFDIERINSIEKQTKHDVIAFLTNLSENIGPEARFMHTGMTSSDVIDTCIAVQLKQASELLLNRIEKLLAALKKKAFETKNMLCIGRSHGIHAEPTTMGLKFAQAYAEFERNYKRLEMAKEEISICKISGAIGNYANIDPAIEKHVANNLGLQSEKISTQIIPRDRHAYFITIIALISSSIERFANEIRHLQRTEVREAEEYFSEGQKGSSAMPHKRNPVLSENLSGLSRILRGNLIPAMENISLWHERDISHSSAERIILPDSTIVLDFALDRLTNIIENIVLYPKQMLKNLHLLGGLHFSQSILLELTKKGMQREDAYVAVQRNAMKTWNTIQSENTATNDIFLKSLLNDIEITKYLKKEALEKLFDLDKFIKQVDYIFENVFEKK